MNYLFNRFWERPTSSYYHGPTDEALAIMEIAKILQFSNYDELGLIWNTQKQEIMNNATFWCNHKYDRPEVFWPIVLQDNPTELNEDLRNIIRISLVLATSSADAERLFSVQ